jgi:hypothetical protein
MEILNKIKSFFTKEEKPVEQKPIEPVPEVKDKLECLFCLEPITEVDSIRVLNGDKYHKRCVKKMKKAFLEGKNLNDIQYKGGLDGG